MLRQRRQLEWNGVQLRQQLLLHLHLRMRPSQQLRHLQLRRRQRLLRARL